MLSSQVMCIYTGTHQLFPTRVLAEGVRLAIHVSILSDGGRNVITVGLAHETMHVCAWVCLNGPVIQHTNDCTQSINMQGADTKLI